MYINAHYISHQRGIYKISKFYSQPISKLNEIPSQVISYLIVESHELKYTLNDYWFNIKKDVNNLFLETVRFFIDIKIILSEKYVTSFKI